MENLWNIMAGNMEFLLRITVAMLLGALVGFERQRRGRSAGLRTNILVCLGSAAIIVAFEKLLCEFHLDSGSIIRMDPARAAAGVITGVGFLGAGTIIKNDNFVRGLTTAASIWIVAAIGITAGLGEYTIAITVTILVLITLYALHQISINADHYFFLSLKWNGDMTLLNEITDMLEKDLIYVKSRNVIFKPDSGECHATLGVRMRYKWYDKPELVALCSDSRFTEIHWNDTA